MFSNLSSSSTSLATVTPSLVTFGAPNDLSRTTFLPFGPRVTVTASARILTPRRIASRASRLNFTIFAAIFSSSNLPEFLLSFDDAEDVLLAHDQMFLAINVDFSTGIFSEKHAIIYLYIQRSDLTIVTDFSLAHRNDLSLLGLFLGGIGNDDSTLAFFLFLDALDDDPVLQRLDIHCLPPF